MTSTPDLSNAITAVFPRQPGGRVWARHVWQLWSDAGLVPDDLDEDADHAPAVVLIGSLALLLSRVRSTGDELQEDLHGSWPLMTPFQLGYYCGAHGVDPILPGDDFTASLSASEHALPLAMRFLQQVQERQLAFADLRAVDPQGQQHYPLASDEVDRLLNHPTIDSIAAHERFVELWELGERITCRICASVAERLDAPTEDPAGTPRPGDARRNEDALPGMPSSRRTDD